MVLRCVVPADYSTLQNCNGDEAAWHSRLKLLDRLPPQVALCLTGREVGGRPAVDLARDLPLLPRKRRMIFWDNWIALDENAVKRPPWSCIPQQAAALYNSAQYGYLLNLCFPLQSIIHVLFMLVNRNLQRTDLITRAATEWAEYLHDANPATISALRRAIEDDNFTSYEMFKKHYPNVVALDYFKDMTR